MAMHFQIALALIFIPSICAVPGGKEAYPVFPPFIDDDGNQVQGSIEFEFALAAINTVRAQCNDTANFPSLTAGDVVLYDDECTRQTVAGQQVITLSFDVPAARDSIDPIDSLYVLIANVPPVDDINSSALGLNATRTVDVGITVPSSKDPTGTANDFQLLGIRKLDPETGDGNTKWTCAYTKDDGTYVSSDIGNMEMNMTDMDTGNDADNTRRRAGRLRGPMRQPVGSDADFIPIYGRRFLPEPPAITAPPTPREVVPDNLSPDARKAILDTLPENYDARTIAGLGGQAPIASVPADQGSCGSCYAFGAATAIAYRLFKSSGGKFNVVPSPQQAMTCSNGCEGGDADVVHDALVISYVPAFTMQRYTAKVDPADKDAFCMADPNATKIQAELRNSIPYKNKRNTVDSPDIGPKSASTSYLGEEAIMQELYANGPGSMYVQVETLFQSYPDNAETCNGILTDRKCTTGSVKGADANGRCLLTQTNHAVTVIGWGVDNVGCPEKGLPGPLRYWILQNSHGEGWGDCDGIGCGLMRLERGRNALGVEAEGMVVGFPDANNAKMCPDKSNSSTWCKNGGSFKADCTCYCPRQYGFSGPTCEVCALNCAGAAPVIAPANPLKGKPAMCECPCSKGYWKPTNLAGYSDCGIAAGIWVDGEVSPLLNNINETIKEYVQSTTVPATFQVRFTKITGSNTAAQSPHYGDMIVAVKAGTKPWTKEAGWDSIKGKMDVCGEKKVENNKLVDCPVDVAWLSDASLVQSTGTIQIAEQGAYDVYFVKYMGKSEFGVDKGFGKDFAPLPFKLFVGSISGRRAGAAGPLASQAQLKQAVANSSAANKQEQQTRISNIIAVKSAKVLSLQAALDANNSAKQALEEQRNSNRTVYFAVILRGVTRASFTMVEETAFKAVLANFTSVCSPKDAQGKPLAGSTNLTKFADCTVRDVTVQRSDRNMTGDISTTAMAVFSLVVAHNISAAAAGVDQLSRTVATGSLLRALRTASPRLASLTNVSLYLSPQKLSPLIDQSTLTSQLASKAVGEVVALLARPGLTVGVVKGSSTVPLDLSAFKAFSMSPDQTSVEVMKRFDPKVAGAMQVKDLAPGFGAVQLSLAPADDFKPLRIALSQASSTARRAGDTTMCRLNKAGAKAVDACSCPAMDCAGDVTCVTNQGVQRANTGSWVVQVAPASLCQTTTTTTSLAPQPTSTPAADTSKTNQSLSPTTTPIPKFSAGRPPVAPAKILVSLAAAAMLCAAAMPLA